MIEYETRLKAWGNSIGIVIPKDKLEGERLKKNQVVRVIISQAKMTTVKDIFGKLKNWKKPTDRIMKEVHKELDSKMFREGWK